MNPERGVVHLVDDDERVREAIESLLSSFGFRVYEYASAGAYVTSDKPDAVACLILDVGLPDISGLELQTQLASASHPPIVFVTGRGDIPSSVRAMKAGAVDFLQKPFRPDELLDAVNAALELHREQRRASAELATLRARHATLTRREQEVLPLIVRGLLNKQAAAELGISEVTLQIHRSQIMKKMAAASVAELVHMTVKLGMAPAGPGRRATAATDAGRSGDAPMQKPPR